VTTASFADIRTENEAKLVVPPELRDQVWQYLLDRFVNDKTFIKSLDPSLDSYWYDEIFTDVYFDTPDLALYGNKSSVRFRTRENLTNPEALKSGRQLVQVKINSIDPNVMSRGEIKFDVVTSTKKPKTLDDLHVLLGLIKAKQRDDFKSVMDQLHIDPYTLRPVLTLHQDRWSIYIPRNGQDFISIRLDTDTSQMLWANFYHIEIEPELNEVPYTAASPAERKIMEQINAAMINDILQKFPQVKVDLTPKYNKTFNYFTAQIPRLRFLVKYDLIH
jgi:hypothetical protein